MAKKQCYLVVNKVNKNKNVAKFKLVTEPTSDQTYSQKNIQNYPDIYVKKDEIVEFPLYSDPNTIVQFHKLYDETLENEKYFNNITFPTSEDGYAYYTGYVYMRETGDQLWNLFDNITFYNGGTNIHRLVECDVVVNGNTYYRESYFTLSDVCTFNKIYVDLDSLTCKRRIRHKDDANPSHTYNGVYYQPAYNCYDENFNLLKYDNDAPVLVYIAGGIINTSSLLNTQLRLFREGSTNGSWNGNANLNKIYSKDILNIKTNTKTYIPLNDDNLPVKYMNDTPYKIIEENGIKYAHPGRVASSIDNGQFFVKQSELNTNPDVIKRCHLIHGCDNILFLGENTAPKVTYTINPNPSNARVKLTAIGYEQIGNSITVAENTDVQWKVSKKGYTTQSGTKSLTNSNATETKRLNVSTHTYTIHSTPSNATVTLTASGYTQSGNSITVPYNTTVSWSVSCYSYITQSGTTVITEDKDDNVELLSDLVTLTINPTPSNATVTLTADGFVQEGNSITVINGTSVTYTVTASHYNTKSATKTVTNNETLNVSLNKTLYKFTINPMPVDSTVTLTASGYTQSGNSISVPYGTNVNYSVAYQHYNTVTGTYNVKSAYTLPVTLELTQYTLTVNTVPADATLTLTASGYTPSGNTVTAPYGTVVNYTVTKNNYYTKTGTITIDSTKTVQIVTTKIYENRVDTDGFSYTFNSGELVLTGYTGSSPNLVGPVIEEL